MAELYLLCQVIHKQRQHLPSIHDMVLMVASVQKYFVRIHEETREEYYSHLGRESTTVHKIPVEYVRVVNRRKTILSTLRKHVHATYSCSAVSAVKMEDFIRFFFIFAQNLDRGYTLEPPG